MSIHSITVSRREVAKVFVEVEDGTDPSKTDKRILAHAVKAGWVADDWKPTEIEVEKVEPAPDDVADEFCVVDGNPLPTLESRAARIGVSLRTLTKWQASGVNVFDDHAVRAYVGSQKRWNPRIASEFQPRLGSV